MKITTLRLALVAGTFAVLGASTLAPSASAKPKNKDVKNARKEVRKERRDVRRADDREERRDEREDLRDARERLRRERRENRNDNGYNRNRPGYGNNGNYRPGYGNNGYNRPGYNNGGYRPGYGNNGNGYNNGFRSYTGEVVNVVSDSRVDVRIGGQVYNVYISSRLPRRLDRGDIVRVSGVRQNNNDIRQADVQIINNR